MKRINFDGKGVDIYMYYDNSHSICRLTDYKTHLSSLTSQFDKELYIGQNISIFRENNTATAARFEK